jgi:hypothetical protein
MRRSSVSFRLFAFVPWLAALGVGACSQDETQPPAQEANNQEASGFNEVANAKLPVTLSDLPLRLQYIFYFTNYPLSYHFDKRDEDKNSLYTTFQSLSVHLNDTAKKEITACSNRNRWNLAWYQAATQYRLGGVGENLPIKFTENQKVTKKMNDLLDEFKKEKRPLIILTKVSPSSYNPEQNTYFEVVTGEFFCGEQNPPGPVTYDDSERLLHAGKPVEISKIPQLSAPATSP